MVHGELAEIVILIRMGRAHICITEPVPISAPAPNQCGVTPMISRFFATLRNARTLNELESFHRAELRDAGVTDDALRAFVSGR